MVVRIRLLFPAALVLLAVAPAPAGADARVELIQFRFDPGDVTIAVGEEVVWHHADSQPHTVTSTRTPPGQSFDSHQGCTPPVTPADPRCMNRGNEYPRTFSVAGTYEYFCKVHTYMTGVIRVQAQSSGTTSTAAPVTTAPSGTPTAGRTGTTAAGGAGQSPAQEATTTSSVADTTTTTLVPGEAPELIPAEDAAARGSDGGGDEVGLAGLVGVLALVASGGGLLLWRLRPGG